MLYDDAVSMWPRMEVEFFNPDFPPDNKIKKVIEVMYWKWYGLVAPSFVTTNGSVDFLLSCLPKENHEQVEAFYEWVRLFK